MIKLLVYVLMFLTTLLHIWIKIWYTMNYIWEYKFMNPHHRFLTKFITFRIQISVGYRDWLETSTHEHTWYICVFIIWYTLYGFSFFRFSDPLRVLSTWTNPESLLTDQDPKRNTRIWIKFFEYLAGSKCLSPKVLYLVETYPNMILQT